MFETCITILGNRGIYPKETVLCDEVGFSCYKGVPLWFSVIYKKNRLNYKYHEKPTLLRAAFLINFRDFPVYDFPLYSSKCTIYISTTEKPDLTQILKRARIILRGAARLPILYSPRKHLADHEKRMSKIMDIRSKPEYIDLFHCKRKPFNQLLDEWRGSYRFADKKCSAKAVKKYYELFLQSSRFIHIALYYYNNAASLTNNHYIEDAGINLHLVLEAIIRDFMELHSIKNKRKAIETLISKIWPPGWGTDYLDDLYKSRNQFLAHIDENMFTEDQNIHDPDEYCYDTFESITYLITRYIRYKNRTINSGG